MQKLIRFGLTGLVTTAIHYGVTMALVDGARMHPAPANGIAFVCATVFGFTVNSLWSFARPMNAARFVRYLLVCAVALVVAIALSAVVYRLGFHYLIATTAVAVTVPAFTFLAHARWTFR